MSIKKMVLSGLFIALGLVFPSIFHLLGMIGGQIFLPMHIPVLLAGFILGPVWGLLVGIVTPVLSSILTSMPPLMPMLPIMFVELGFYGFIAGYMYQIKNFNVFISLIIAMFIGRVASAIVVYFLVQWFAVSLPSNPLLFIKGGIITGLPGLLIQFIIIPMTLYLLKRMFVSKPNKENVL